MARLAGLFEVLEGVFAAPQVMVVPAFIVTGNAAATANNIVDGEPLFRGAAAASLFDVVLHVAWGVLLYEILRVVNRTVALLAMSLLVIGCALQAVAGVLLLAPIAVLSGRGSLTAFTPEQVQTLAFVALRWNAYAYDIFLAFFGFWLIATGYLIYRSTFMPRIIGVLLIIDGLGWSTFLSPPLGSTLFPFVAVGSGLGELPLIAWLLIKGVNVERWKTTAARSHHVLEPA